jgi:hypothetical protein
MAGFAVISYDMQTLDDEFQALTPDHRHVWLAMLAIQWPQCGIFKGGIAPLMNATVRTCSRTPRNAGLAPMIPANSRGPSSSGLCPGID